MQCLRVRRYGALATAGNRNYQIFTWYQVCSFDRRCTGTRVQLSVVGMPVPSGMAYASRLIGRVLFLRGAVFVCAELRILQHQHTQSHRPVPNSRSLPPAAISPQLAAAAAAAVVAAAAGGAELTAAL